MPRTRKAPLTACPENWRSNLPSNHSKYIFRGAICALTVKISLPTVKSSASTVIVLFLKRVIRECPSNNFRCHDLQIVIVIVMLIYSVTFMYFFRYYYIMFVQLCLEVLEVMSTESTNIFYLIYYGV